MWTCQHADRIHASTRRGGVAGECRKRAVVMDREVQERGAREEALEEMLHGLARRDERRAVCHVRQYRRDDVDAAGQQAAT